ncbi:MAG: hypothetical protein JJE52_12905 [Acidimicrobiia bacterium]|nr:hypothetical protein [Acidimicrobiia bacterium]
MIEIELSSGNEPLMMRSCSACDAREWSKEGEGLDLRGALDRLSQTGSTRRQSR